MKDPNFRIAYRVAHTLDLMERETEETPPVIESYVQRGLLLFEEKFNPGGWSRQAEELWLADAQFATLGKLGKVPRDTLRRAHHAHLKTRRVKVAAAFYPVAWETDSANTSMRVPDEAPPWPVTQLHVPTFLPALPKKKPEIGAKWNGSRELRYGFAKFIVPHAATLSAKDAMGATVDITFAGAPVSDSKNGFTLTLTLSGKLQVKIDTDNLAPLSATWDLLTVVHGHYYIKDKAFDLKIFQAQAKGELHVIPVGFDDTLVVGQFSN